MNIIAIDYGKKKIGLAWSEGALAKPYKVIRYELPDEGLAAVIKEVSAIKAQEIVIGISEGQSALEAGKFGRMLGKMTGRKIFFVDETLTTSEASRLAREAGISLKKRKKMEDAYAAALILENFLERKRKK